MHKALTTAVLAVPFAAGFTGLCHAAGGGTVVVTSSHEFTRCIAEGGDEFYEEGDDIRICRFTDGYWEGSEIWCDADFDDCEFVSVPPSAHPGPAGQTQAPVQGGAFGAAASTTRNLQLQD